MLERLDENAKGEGVCTCVDLDDNADDEAEEDAEDDAEEAEDGLADDDESLNAVEAVFDCDGLDADVGLDSEEGRVDLIEVEVDMFTGSSSIDDVMPSRVLTLSIASIAAMVSPRPPPV